MDVAPYMARLLHAPGTLVRVYVNDLPMYDRAVMSWCTPVFPATPWFVPGENKIVIEVADAPVNPDIPTVPKDFELLFFGEGKNLERDEKRLYWQRYPDFVDRLPAEERTLPVRWTDTFTPEGGIPEPIWASSSPEKIPEEGTPELWRAVYELHRAFVSRDIDALVDAAALKLEDQQRYFGPIPGLTRSQVKKEHEAMLREDWDVAPFEPKDLRFRSCAGGRVAYATHKDGGPALLAKHKHASQAWKVKPLLVRRDTEWRIFR